MSPQPEATIDLGTVFKGSPEGRIVKAQGGTRPLGPTDVAIDIVLSGLCGTDLHMIKKDMVLGHEGVGKVSKIGSLVKGFKIGDRVGWGFVHSTCLQAGCPGCSKGMDTQCPEKTQYGVDDLDQGGFGDRAVFDYRFVHKVPDGLELANAGPLQCAGATVMGAIWSAGVTPFDRVGVLGIGGLGHLALQYLSKMGCDVVAFSGSDSKKDEATRLGANEFVAAKNNPKLEGVKPVDYLLVTTSAQPDWSIYLKVMSPGGKILPLSVDGGNLEIPYMPIISKDIIVKGTYVAPRHVHDEMMKFAARHKIAPMTEELPMTEEGLNKAAERLSKGDVRYRFILRNPNNKE